MAASTYHIGRFLMDANNGKLNEIQDLIIKSASLVTKGADYLIDQLKQNHGIDLNMPLDKNKALGQEVGNYLKQFAGPEKKVVDDYKKNH